METMSPFLCRTISCGQSTKMNIDPVKYNFSEVLVFKTNSRGCLPDGIIQRFFPSSRDLVLPYICTSPRGGKTWIHLVFYRSRRHWSSVTTPTASITELRYKERTYDVFIGLNFSF